MGDLALVLSAEVEHRLKLFALSSAGRLDIGEDFQDGDAIALAAILNFARLRRKVLGLVCLLVGRNANVDHRAAHAEVVSRDRRAGQELTALPRRGCKAVPFGVCGTSLLESRAWAHDYSLLKITCEPQRAPARKGAANPVRFISETASAWGQAK